MSSSPVRLLAAITLPLGFSLACGPIQTYGGGLQVICDAPNTCTECRNATPDMKATFLARHIEERLWNPSATNAFEALAYATSETKAEILRHEAQANGISSCPMADFFDDMAQAELGWDLDNVCALSSSCETFDASDPSSLMGCAERLDLRTPIADALDALPTASPQAFGAGLNALAATHDVPECPAADAFEAAP